MKVKIYNQSGEASGASIELDPKIFELAKTRPELVHQVAVSMLANRRNVVASTKTRGEVRGGGKKPWQQKGTGRARVGSIRSPLWRGGGVTFGPRPGRNFRKTVDEKMKRLSLVSVLTDRAKAQRLYVLDKFEITAGKTKEFAKKIAELQKKLNIGSKKVLLVLPDKQEKIILAARNLPKVLVRDAGNLNLLDLLGVEYILLVREVLPILEKRFLT